MVCIYCGASTQVKNSRLQKRANKVWRRRQCTGCQAIFSSIEQGIYEGALAVRYNTSHITPFLRDTLFLSVYEACRHRKSAINEATSLTDTIIGKLLSKRPSEGLVERNDIVKAGGDVLKRFDRAAYVQYTAFHPMKLR